MGSMYIQQNVGTIWKNVDLFIHVKIFKKAIF